MANSKAATDGGATRATIDTTGRVVLGDAMRGAVGSMVLQFVSSSFSGSIVIKARVTGSGIADDAGVPIPYQRRNTAGTVSDDTIVGDAITDSALVVVVADGLDIILDATVASGSMAVYVRTVRG